jgi:hypothetical protein
MNHDPTIPFILKPLELFFPAERKRKIVSGNIIIAPRIIPRDLECEFVNSHIRKPIILLSEMTTSFWALQNNLHGFMYEGDIGKEELEDSFIVSNNLSYEEASAKAEAFYIEWNASTVRPYPQ